MPSVQTGIDISSIFKIHYKEYLFKSEALFLFLDKSSKKWQINLREKIWKRPTLKEGTKQFRRNGHYEKTKIQNNIIYKTVLLDLDSALIV